MNSSSKEQKRTLGMWFRSLRRTSQVAIVMILIAAVGVVAYAASVLFNTAHSTTSLSKDKYIEVSLTGAEASGSIRPGSTVALSPVLTNQGDIKLYRARKDYGAGC